MTKLHKALLKIIVRHKPRKMNRTKFSKWRTYCKHSYSFDKKPTYMAGSASGQYAANSVLWLPERARWSDTARPGLPVSFPQIKFRQKSSECTKVFCR